MMTRQRRLYALVSMTIVLLFGAACTPEQALQWLAAHPEAHLAAISAESGPTPAQWAALRKCENGGSYTSKPSDAYRGAYQFDYQTWKTQGGTGDPAAAPPHEQDARAKTLYAQRGWRPWPVCGRKHLR